MQDTPKAEESVVTPTPGTMTTQGARDLKKTIEALFAETINQFQVMTGLNVENVCVTMTDVSTIGNRTAPRRVANVEIYVAL